MYLAEHTLATLLPREVPGGGQREMNQTHRGGSLAQSAETAGRPHFRGDQIGHLIGVARVDGGQLFDFGHPLPNVQPRPRTVIERLPREPDGGVDVFGAGGLDVADGLFGVRRNNRHLPEAGGLLPTSSDEQLVIGAVAEKLRHRGDLRNSLSSPT